MAGPAGFSDLINRKYDIQQEQADSSRDLQQAQAASITAASPFENALKAAQTAQTNATAGTIAPLADASIAATKAGIGETQARTGLYGAQTQDVMQDTALMPDIVRLQLKNGLAGRSGVADYTGNAAGNPGASGSTITGSNVRSVLGGGTVGTMSNTYTDPNTGLLHPLLTDTNGQKYYLDDQGNRVQPHAKGTARVKATKGPVMASPPQNGMVSPLGGMMQPQAQPPAGAPDFLGILHAAIGATRVPGRPNGGQDSVKAVLAPGEAVLTSGAADKVGRSKIASLNAKHPPGAPAKGAPAAKGKPPIAAKKGAHAPPPPQARGHFAPGMASPQPTGFAAHLQAAQQRPRG